MMSQVASTKICHYPKQLWLNELSVDSTPPTAVPLSTQELRRITPWKKVNTEAASTGVFKYHQVNTYFVPSWVKRIVKESQNLIVLYVHRYPKLDCKTPYLPSISHQIHTHTQCIGLRHVRDELNESHLELAACFVEQGHDVLIIFDHVKSFGYQAIDLGENFVVYAKLSSASRSVSDQSAIHLGPVYQPNFSAWRTHLNSTRSPSFIEKQVCHA